MRARGKEIVHPFAHLEAGLRCGDRSMPEEINRIVTDTIADLLRTPSSDADENLKREGIPELKIIRVGNIMLDSYERLRSKIENENAAAHFGLAAGKYGVVTLHRPANVDDETMLRALADMLFDVGSRLPLIFPVHPRTRQRLQSCGLLERLTTCPSIRLTEPMCARRYGTGRPQVEWLPA